MPRDPISPTSAALRFRADAVTVDFGAAVALRAVTLEVPARQVVGVIGSNGAGKTTLLDVIAGATQPASGILSLDGQRVRYKRSRPRRLGVARTVQGLNLPEQKTVLEYVLSGVTAPPRTGLGELLSISRADRGGAADPDHAVQVLKEFGLAAAVEHRIDTLPLAAQVRAAIAHAMITNPRLLLLDEPGAGLGPDERSELAALIRQLAKRPGRDCSVVLVAHHFDLIEQCCDAVTVLDAGAVIASGTADDIRSDSTVAASYFV